MIRAAFIIAMIPGSATALVCGPYEGITSVLEDGQGKALQSSGLAANGALIEIYVAEAGAWTALAVSPNGLACIMSSGDDWQMAPQGDPA